MHSAISTCFPRTRPGHDGQNVSLEVDGIRGGVLRNTIVRVTSQSGLECHVDTEEANAMGLSSSSRVRIVQ